VFKKKSLPCNFHFYITIFKRNVFPTPTDGVMYPSCTHSDLAPSAMEARDAVVALDGLLAFVTLAVSVPFDPVVDHLLGRLLRLDVGRYAGGGSPLDAPLVHRVLTD
jgi:hypothetical protein